MQYTNASWYGETEWICIWILFNPLFSALIHPQKTCTIKLKNATEGHIIAIDKQCAHLKSSVESGIGSP